MLVPIKQQENRSVWLSLKNRVFFGLWITGLVSGCCVSAQDTAATWLMNALGASPFLLSLMATSASLPFFLFALPAGVISDLVNRQKLLIATYLWLAAAAGLLAISTWLHLVQPHFILAAAFLLGVGFAFGAPVWAAIIPEVVPKSELPSAIILSGVQMNLGGIVGPAFGGFLLPIAGPGMLFSLNALAFLFGAAMIARCYRERRRPQPHLENYLEAFAATARYVRYTPAIQVILARDFLFGLFIAVVPALLPVVAFQHLRLQANQLGMVFTSLRASPKPGESSISLGTSDRVVGTSRAGTIKAFSHHGRLASASFIGSSTNGPIINNLESEIILTSGDSSIGGKVAVGHVIASDFRSHSSPNRTVDLGSWRDDKKTVPVILAIGSNYSRGASHLTDTVRTFSPSGMAEELTALINRVLGLHPLAAVLKTDVNLVLANFFPWITNRLWSSLSVFEQVILLQSHGYANPLEVIGRLFLQLRPHLVAVIFHGGPDFVHLYASEWISTYVDADPISPPLLLFSDNLSGRAKVKGTTDSLFI